MSLIGLIFYIIIRLYALFSLLIGILIMPIWYISEKTNPFYQLKSATEDINTIGDLIVYLFFVPAWIDSVFGYGFVKIFYNKFTIGFMNIKIKR